MEKVPGTLEDLAESVTPNLDRVRLLLDQIGAEDGAVLQRMLGSVLAAAPDYLRPASTLVLAEALGGAGDDRVVRFAAALQCVVAATTVHHGWAGGERADGLDHLQVLAGDYLYARAAVLVAQLHDLRLMSALSSAIMQLSSQVEAHPDRPSFSSLFQLSAFGTALLLNLDEERRHAVTTFGTLLDQLGAPSVQPTMLPGLLAAAGRWIRLFALPQTVSRLESFAALVAARREAPGGQGAAPRDSLSYGVSE